MLRSYRVVLKEFLPHISGTVKESATFTDKGLWFRFLVRTKSLRRRTEAKRKRAEEDPTLMLYTSVNSLLLSLV